MAEIRWTPQAADDIETITEFISADSPRYAQLFAMDIFSAVEVLVDFPESGRIVPEMNDHALREVILGNYRIVYRFRSSVVEILTVYHGARLLNMSYLK